MALPSCFSPVEFANSNPRVCTSVGRRQQLSPWTSQERGRCPFCKAWQSRTQDAVWFSEEGTPGSLPSSSGRLGPANRVCQNRDIHFLEQTCAHSALIRRCRHPIWICAQRKPGPREGLSGQQCQLFMTDDEDMGPAVMVRRWPAGKGSQPGSGREEGRQEVPCRGGRKCREVLAQLVFLVCKAQRTHRSRATCISMCHQDS